MTLLEKLSKEPFVLSMSSGYFGFFAHCGFAKAVFSEGLKPKLMTGSSAGAIVASCLASGLTPTDMEKAFLTLGRKNYWDPGIGFGFLKGDVFEKTLSEYVVDDMNKAKYPLHIATFNVFKQKTEIFSEGYLPRIVRASSAMPLFFHPVKIGRHFYLDGGVQDKMAWSGINDTDLVFGHCLPSADRVDWFEKKSKNANKNRLLLKVENLPPTGPGKFANGPKAIAMIYEATKRMLASTIIKE